GAANDAAIVGDPRGSQTDRHQIRLRYRSVRRLHGAYRRQARVLVPDANVGDGRQVVTTIEGLSPDSSHPLQKAWLAEQVPQCGYCQSGQIMSAADLLKQNPKPTRNQIIEHMSTNICRCGTYQRIVRAIERATREA